MLTTAVQQSLVEPSPSQSLYLLTLGFSHFFMITIRVIICVTIDKSVLLIYIHWLMTPIFQHGF